MTRPKVVVVGGGFGGLQVVRQLRRTNANITLIDRNNYHLFQPLLYQVATGGLSPANIATPLRSIFRRQKNCNVLLGEVDDFDAEASQLVLSNGRLDFDYLVVASGSTHSYFGNDEWRAHAPGLKTLADATEIRRKIYIALESAERTDDPDLRRELMTFIIVGGGPTGVELAGSLAEVTRQTLKDDFRRINPGDATILLIESSEHVLDFYPEELCKYSESKLADLGVELINHTRVTDVQESQVTITKNFPEDVSFEERSRVIRTQTILWAAGVQASGLGPKIAKAYGAEVDRGGRVLVTPTLNVGTARNVFVIGDLAKFVAGDEPLPGTAPVAIQEGKYVGNRIAGSLKGKEGDEAFAYRDLGSMATIGRNSAIAWIGGRKFKGVIAWVLWLTIHLMQITQFHNRLLVFFQWVWSYFTYNRAARLITGVNTDEDRLIKKARINAEDRHSLLKQVDSVSDATRIDVGS
jgi:NADH dehydrogenase